MPSCASISRVAPSSTSMPCARWRCTSESRTCPSASSCSTTIHLRQVLRRYVKLAWDADWDAQSHELLREHARSSPQVALGNVAAWFEPSLETLAIYLYVRRLLGQARVSNIANQVRGLGILGFDPEPLEPWVETVLARWEREPVWRGRVIADAEDRLTESDLQKIAAILPIRSPAELWTVIQEAETPAAIYELARRLLDGTPESELDTEIGAWLAHRPQKLDALPDTRHRASRRGGHRVPG